MEYIKEVFQKHHVKVYGFGQCPESLSHPYAGLTHLISFAIPLLDTIMKPVEKGPTHEYFHHYRTVNTRIDQIAYEIAHVLEGHGYAALPIAASQSINKEDQVTYAGLYSHRQGARSAGIGHIGKNGSLMTEEYGPRVRLGTILTNAPLPVQPVEDMDLCGTCSSCVDACPAMALSGQVFDPHRTYNNQFDPKACSRHMKDAYMMIGRGSVCGICLAVCPRGWKR